MSRLICLSVLTIGVLFAHPAAAQRPQDRTSRAVFRELVFLPYYGVFDHLSFSLDRGTLTLSGQVRRPSLKSDAENAVKDIEGIERVVNNIEVLPTSQNDDRIRIALYRAIYRHDALERYAIQAVPPIHIIVKGGHATLEGYVDSQLDKTVAAAQARSVSGVFSVTDNLKVER
jgi:hyperosmotically inducible protein